MGKMLFRLALFVLLATLVSCANWNEEAGVDNRWRASEAPQWVVGESTAEDVMSFLGPPSQLVELGDQIVYYYMKQHESGGGYFFIVYNNSETRIQYDRAIFFFDQAGVLLRYSYSDESLPYEQ